MDDESFEAHQNGRPRRHDGKDPWSLATRAEVLADPERRAAVSVDLAREPTVPTAGDAVAVLIHRERNDVQGRFEEVWLDVVAVEGLAIQATFDSQPTYVRGVSAGDALTLDVAHVLSVRRLKAARP
ncbi:MAG: hypothetical protein U1F43_03510 [Myxococcota bacterium]